ncbi:ecto-ADP-ribosyltransferase 5-like [Chelonoidis abingdonii]|uniref:ecto-ADP-ribosyltransferase 5-like n=1 Tax=Chelonoidis abingdonii TaxID=106734 RepID=UPI003F497A43
MGTCKEKICLPRGFKDERERALIKRFVPGSTNRTCSHFNCAYLGGEYWAEHQE